MAKDDYDYLVFKILTYLYVCFRRRGHFETSTFLKRLFLRKCRKIMLLTCCVS